VSTSVPSIPYTLGDRLWVDGQQVPGTWWYLTIHGPTWLAMDVDDDSNWYWGQGQERSLIALTPESPSVSPDGTYVAALGTENGQGIVWAQDTRPPGSGLGNVPVEDVHIQAVTNDGKVIVQGADTSMMWLAESGGGTVDLTETAPGVQFLQSTAAGLVVSDGDESVQYLAEISDDGVLSKIRDLPSLERLEVSPGGESLAGAPFGTTQGEVTEIGSLRAGSVDGSQLTTFTPPDGWAFKVQQWAWENDDDLVSAVVKGRTERLVRCSLLTESCVLVDAP
jgi:hypothetical protein